MIAAERTVLILLAAGRSQRFGDLDKLTQDFLGDRRTELDGGLFPMRDPAVALDLERPGKCLKRRQRGP